MRDERVTIWRPNTPADERKGLLACVEEALVQPSISAASTTITHEVALYQAEAPTISIAQARLLTPHDWELVEAFEPGSGAYYFDPQRAPLCGVVVDGRLLSLAHSSRRTAEACELGIDTLAEARRRGYARAATILWAASIAREGLIPLYSALATNAASLYLAVSAGYRSFAHAAYC
jgi:hypothetical protein